jgi:PAS domain S-box-containing protein
MSASAKRIELAEATASILLVDDRASNLLALEAVLKPLGQKLVRASSGEEALKRIYAEDFAVILMDVRMPGMDGLRAMELIKQREESAYIPIIFLTAAALDSSDVAGGYARGAVDFLLKPFDPDILRSKVAVFVDLYLKEQTIKRQAALLHERDRKMFERRSEQRFRSLMDALPQCVWVARSDRLFHSCNKQAAEYTGIRTDEPVPYSQLVEFMHPEDHALAQAKWDIATGTEHETEFQVRLTSRSDGALRWFLMRQVPERDEAGKVTGWIVTATDIDAEHQALKRAEAANQMKEEFLAIVSHELRNPLNAIKGWTYLLRMGNLDEAKTEKALDSIERNVDLQTKLVEEILDVSSIIRGKVNLSWRPLQLMPVVEEALATIRATAHAKGVELEYEADAPTDRITGDAGRLQQVFWNLLSNAIKFTPSDGRVTVRVTQRGHDLAVMVSDTGQGVSPDFLPYVFERFRQADPRITRAHGGLGLGLAIVRHLVELHGGTVKAESDGVNRGATFWVFLPISALEPARNWPDAEGGNDKLSLEGLSVLVVEDDTDSRDLLAEALRNVGAQVQTASSAQESLTLIDNSLPNLLLSDIAMPGFDGYELIRKIRKRIPDAEMPAIAVTGLGSPADQDRALAEGFQLCLVKPISVQRLIESIVKLINRPESVLTG